MVAVARARGISSAPPSAPRWTRVWPLSVAVGVIPVLLATGIAVLSGAWGTPRTDDWAFARIAFSLHATGHLHLVGWSQMNLVGLVAWAQPWLWLFGDHMWVLDLSAAALVGAGLAAFFHVCRRVVSTPAALLGVISLLVFPGFLRDIPTFMTDAPALAVGAASLAAGVAALSSGGRRQVMLLCCAGVLGFFAFTIREFAIAAPLAVLAAVYLRSRAERRRVVVAAAALLAVCGAFYLWRTALPGSQALSGRPAVSAIAMTLAQAACTACLGLVPALVWTARSWWHPQLPGIRRRGHLIGALIALIPVAVMHSAGGSTTWLLGHYLDRTGVNGNVDTLGSRPVLIPGFAWTLITLAAIASMVVVCGLLAEWLATRRGRSTAPQATLLGVHVALVTMACAAAAVLNGQLFDRYLWPAVLSGSVLILNRWAGNDAATLPPKRDPPRRLLGVSIAAAAAVAIALTLNSAAFDAARWRAGQQLVAGGLPAQAVDAGFEWTGAHATANADLTQSHTNGGATSWWTKWFPHEVICAVVTASPVDMPGYVRSGTRRWNLLLVAVPERLFLYRSVDPRCAQFRTSPPG